MGVQDHPSRNLILPGALLLQNLFFPQNFLLLFIIIIIVVSGRTLSKKLFCITLSYNVSVWNIISLWDESLKELAPFFMIIWTKYNLCC